jgi:hypothetical protein
MGLTVKRLIMGRQQTPEEEVQERPGDPKEPEVVVVEDPKVTVEVEAGPV